jgi:circadian clock protein KaiC
MGHSNEVREFLITSKGLGLVDVYRGPNGVLVGSARKAKMREELRLAKKNNRTHFNKPKKRR